MLFAEEVIRGDPLNPSNVFRFDQVVLNLPGSTDYKPHLPWVYKLHSTDNKIACDIFTYVDDECTTGPSAEE